MTVVQDKTPGRTLAEELRVAEASANDAKRKKQILDDKIAGANLAIETKTRDLERVAGTIYARAEQYEIMRKQLRELGSRLPALEAERRGVEKKLKESQAVLYRIRREIAEHPVYATAVSDQRKLIAQGVKAAEDCWTGTILALPEAVTRFDGAAERELDFERAINIQLRELGLPQIRAQLWNRREVLPLVVASMPLAEMAKNCGELLKQLRSYGSVPATV